MTKLRSWRPDTMAGRVVLHSVEAGNDPVAEAGAGLTVPPEDAEAVEDRHRPVRVESDPVVADREPRALLARELDADAGRPGVARGVGDRLVQDASQLFTRRG